MSGWDVDAIAQWRAARNEYAVLSTYPTDVQGSLDSHGHSLRQTRPIMCNSDFEGGSVKYLRHKAQPEEIAALQNEPMIEPFR